MSIGTTAVCIGGPRDRETITSMGPEFDVVTTSSDPVYDLEASTYRIASFLGVPDVTFWLHQDVGAEEAVTRLLKSYAGTVDA